MTREEVLNSIALKKRFCKDCNLPIVVFDNPYFYERLCILDSLYDCVAKFEDFCSELGNYTHDEVYLAEYNSVKDMIIEALKANVYFQEFNNAQFNKPTVNVGKRNLYVEQNDGGLFFSIDMKKANFSALRHYNKEIFVGCETWEEFVGRFTSSKHMAKSKYIRQVVLGACNPKRQIQYENYLMTILYLHIKESIGDENFEVYSLGEDEIIITIKNPNEPQKFEFNFGVNKMKEIIHSCPLGIGELVRLDMFELFKVQGTDGWTKTYYEQSESGKAGTVEFKCLDAEIFHQIIKHYNGEAITENDLVFYHNGQLARFLKEVNNPWE